MLPTKDGIICGITAKEIICLFDAPDDFWPRLRQFLQDMPSYISELEQLLMQNEIILVRVRDVSILPLDRAINCSTSGPVLRGSGIQWDWRKADPYDVYDRIEFDVPVGSNGDNLDRFWVRMQEMRQSLRIIEQCVEQIPDGLVRTELPLVLRPPAGAEAYGRVESPKGELGFYLVSDGGISPYRCKIRSPSLLNLTMIKDLLVGWKLADMIVSLGSVDINMGEVDR